MHLWLKAHKGSTQLLTDNAYVAELTAAATGRADAKLYDAVAARSTAADEARPVGQQMAEVGTSLSQEGAAIANSAFKSDNPDDTYKLWAATYDADCVTMGFDSPNTSVEQTLAYWPTSDKKGGGGGADDGPVVALDIGCGTGELVQRLVTHLTPREVSNTTFLGFDLSEHMLSIATQRGQYDRIDQLSCAEPWPYADASVDIAFCNGVLIYVQTGDEREVVVSELLRVLKPGGHAVLMIREDNIDQWRPSIDEAEAKERTWRLVHATAPRNNFAKGGIKVGEEVYYRQYIFQRSDAGQLAADTDWHQAQPSVGE